MEFRFSSLALATFLMVAVSALCSCAEEKINEPEEPVIPGISISEVTATSTSVSFKVTPVDAVKFSYSVLPEGTSGGMTTVDSGEETPIVVDGLYPETKYIISAVAVSADNIESDLATAEVVTNAKASVSIKGIVPTHNSAVITFMPVNAKGIRYAVTPEGEEPVEWTELEGNAEADAEVTDLAPSTNYVVTAYAYNDEGDGEEISQSFTTLDEPKALYVELIATSSSVYMAFDFDPSMAGSYVYTYPTTKDSYEFSGTDGFIEYVQNNSWFFMDNYESYKEVSMGQPSSTELYVYAVCKDGSGKIMPETVLEVSVTTKALSQLSSSSAKAELKSVDAKSLSADFEISLSEDCVMYYAGMVQKSYVSEGTINMYVNQNLDSFQLLPVESSDFVATVRNVDPEKEYYAILFAVDRNGDITSLSSKEVKTTEIEYDEHSTADINVVSSSFSNVKFSLTKNNCKDVRFTYAVKADADAGNDQDYYSQLYSQFAQTIMTDESGNFTIDWLSYDTEYVLFTLPVKEDGSFGKPGKLVFSTSRYVKEGTSTVSIELISIDRSNPSFAVAELNVIPDASAGSFMYSSVSAEVYELNKNKIAEYVCGSGVFTTVSPAEEMTVTVDIWFEDYYLVVIPIDKDGKYSAAVVSEKLLFKEDASE